MHFSRVAAVFAEIKSISKRTEITERIASLLREATPKEARYITYLALGSLRPPYEGTVFGVAEKSFVKIVIKMLDISADAVGEALKKHGDIGEVIEQGEWHAQKVLSVTEVYEHLLRLTDIKGSGSQEERLVHITELMRQVSPREAGLVARIILGKLRLGFSDMTIVDALSWLVAGNKSLRKKIEDSYNRCADLGLIAEQVTAKGTADLSIHVGIPIRPAAAERLEDPEAIFEKLGPCVAQPKIDGFRLQVHLDYTGAEHKVHFFSRNLIDMSTQFPDVQTILKGLPVKTAIMEGEAIVYDAKRHAFLPFQETVKRKRKHDIATVAEELPLTLFIFDLLYLDGESYLEKSHHVRRAALATLLKEAQAQVRLIEERRMDSSQAIEDYFHEAIEEGLEGIIVKRPDAAYQPGKRGFNWIKLKRTEEVGGLADTVDAVIVGYYTGRGKRAQFGIGALLVAVYNPSHDVFVTIAKIGTGLTDSEWRDIRKSCDNYAVSEQPKNVLCDPQLRPDVWIAPELVCAVRADEITRSPLHMAGAMAENGVRIGYALRFPRFMGLRPDKSARDATAVQEIVHLYQLARAKSATRQ